MRLTSRRRIARSVAGIVVANSDKACQSVESSIGQVFEHVDVSIDALDGTAPSAIKQCLGGSHGIFPVEPVNKSLYGSFGVGPSKLFKLGVTFRPPIWISRLAFLPRHCTAPETTHPNVRYFWRRNFPSVKQESFNHGCTDANGCVCASSAKAHVR